MELTDKNITILKLLLGMIFLILIKNVFADEIVSKVDFHEFLAGGGDNKIIMDTKRKMEVDYLKVEVEGHKGDKFDIRFKYSKDWLKSYKTIAVKKGIKANGKKSTIYFIPKKGKCPGKKEQCVRIPVIDGISTETKLIESDEIIYGIEIYNGSLFSWLTEVEGTYYFVKCD